MMLKKQRRLLRKKIKYYFSPILLNIENDGINAKEKLIEYDPKIIFYFSAPSSSNIYQIVMWLKYIKLLNIKVYIMVREKSIFKSLGMIEKDIPIVLSKSLSKVEYFLIDSIKIALYCNNSCKNTHLIRFNDIHHVQLLHGDSEKPASYNPMSKIYKSLFVSGQRAIDRYYEHNVEINKDNFKIIGRPQISNIEVLNYDNKDIKTILIAPTWFGFHVDASFSSFFYIKEFIKNIIQIDNKINFIIRLHPLISKKDKRVNNYLINLEKFLLEKNIKYIFSKEVNIMDDFNKSDCILTDISSVPIDYLYTNKPIMHIDINNLKEKLNNEIKYKKYSKAIYLISKDFKNIKDIFNDLSSTDSLKENRLLVKEYYHGIGNPIDKFKYEINRIIINNNYRLE